jgi:uncharacterized protein
MTVQTSVSPLSNKHRFSERTIDQMVRVIADTFNPQRIILFGSYAYGHPVAESDIDLLVIMDSPLREIDQAQEIRRVIKPLFALDILVFKPANLANRLSLGDPFLREIINKGKVLYEFPGT